MIDIMMQSQSAPLQLLSRSNKTIIDIEDANSQDNFIVTKQFTDWNSHYEQICSALHHYDPFDIEHYVGTPATRDK